MYLDSSIDDASTGLPPSIVDTMVHSVLHLTAPSPDDEKHSALHVMAASPDYLCMLLAYHLVVAVDINLQHFLIMKMIFFFYIYINFINEKGITNFKLSNIGTPYPFEFKLLDLMP